ncbi:hypothetical protein [Hydrogenophaga pseudoflava]|uniref:hypothetical protein n=1 Tax=Hydrogenophaga pseudoflava TaxID=47421 RepID=UPI0027E4EE87|nr:hypothetical protein [Hydrogenophaga pseudoflava]MDQ7745407.1 hypothetical protein [Hydrogenophaga pseudoflava]
MNITIDFEGALQRALQPETINPILDKHIGKAIGDAIEEATGWKSEFRKAVTEQLKAAIPHGLREDEAMKFAHILNAAIQKLVGDVNNASVSAAINRATSSLLPNIPERMKLSEFAATLRDGLHKERHEPFYAYMEATDYGTTYIYFDQEERPNSSSRHTDREGMKYRADYRLAVDKDGRVYSLRFEGTNVTPASLPNVVGGFDATIMAFYVGRTTLEIDMDDDDLESLSAEQYD